MLVERHSVGLAATPATALHALEEDNDVVWRISVSTYASRAEFLKFMMETNVAARAKSSDGHGGRDSGELRWSAALYSRGFSVTVFHAAFNVPDPARHPAGYRFVPVDAGVPGGDLLPTGSDADFVGALLRINERLQAPFQDSLREVLAEEGHEEEAPACLVVDPNLRGMQVVAGRLGVLTLALRTGGAACLMAYMAFPALCDKGVLPPPS